MSKFEAFMRGNKKAREEKKYAPTKAFVDNDGNAIEWTFRPITSKEFEQLKVDCTKQTITKSGASTKIDVKAMSAKMVVACTVYPDLYDAELQDSYNVGNATDLLYELVEDPGEYTGLVNFVQELCGFDRFGELVDEAKN